MAGASADIEFSRTVVAIGQDGTFDLELDTLPASGACKTEDMYGSNDCTFNWGQTVNGSFAGNLAHDLDTGSTLSVDLKVNRVIGWKFSCPACGGLCETTVPVINEPISVEMPPCPIPSGGVEVPILSAIPDTSVTNGIKVTAVGNVGVKDASGGDVLSLDIDILVQ